MINPGGIRMALKKEILIRDIYKVYPFNNEIVRAPVDVDNLLRSLSRLILVMRKSISSDRRDESRYKE